MAPPCGYFHVQRVGFRAVTTRCHFRCTFDGILHRTGLQRDTCCLTPTPPPRRIRTCTCWMLPTRFTTPPWRFTHTLCRSAPRTSYSSGLPRRHAPCLPFALLPVSTTFCLRLPGSCATCHLLAVTPPTPHNILLKFFLPFMTFRVVITFPPNQTRIYSSLTRSYPALCPGHCAHRCDMECRSRRAEHLHTP